MTGPWTLRAAAALVLGAGAPTAGAAQGVDVSGHARWRDVGGLAHPIRHARVEAIDAVRGVAVDSAWTGEDGSYRLTLDRSRASRVYLTVLARSGASLVIEPNSGLVHGLRTRAYPLLAGSRALAVDTLHTGRDSVANQAFSILDALEFGGAVVTRLNGAPLPRVEVEFPVETPRTEFVAGRLKILRAHSWDWDVILHEYGHYVSASLALDDTPRGEHFLDSEIEGDKDAAIRLAWAEGLATYLGIMVQREEGLARLGIPRVGDASYTDGARASVSVSLDAPEPPWSFGERSEVTVMRVLYDLYDPPGDPAGSPGDRIGYGAQGMWTMLGATAPGSLGGLWTRIASGAPLAEASDAAAIFTAHFVAPFLLAPDDGDRADKVPPTFRWDGPLTHDRFTLEVLDAAGAVLLREPVSGGMHTPGAAAWRAVRARAQGQPVFWRILAEDTDAPSTGPFGSTVRRLQP